MFEVPLYYQNPWSLFLDIVVREMLRLEISTLHVCWLPGQMGQLKEIRVLEIFPVAEAVE